MSQHLLHEPYCVFPRSLSLSLCRTRLDCQTAESSWSEEAREKRRGQCRRNCMERLGLHGNMFLLYILCFKLTQHESHERLFALYNQHEALVNKRNIHIESLHAFSHYRILIIVSLPPSPASLCSLRTSFCQKSMWTLILMLLLLCELKWNLLVAGVDWASFSPVSILLHTVNN